MMFNMDMWLHYKKYGTGLGMTITILESVFGDYGNYPVDYRPTIYNGFEFTIKILGFGFFIWCDTSLGVTIDAYTPGKVHEIVEWRN